MVPTLPTRNYDIPTGRDWVHVGVSWLMAECHLEIVTEQIIKTLKAFSFILAYAKKRLASLFTLPTLQDPSVLKNSLKLVSEAEKLNTSELAF